MSQLLAAFPFRGCVSYSCVTDRNVLKEGGFVLVHGFKSSILSWPGWRNGAASWWWECVPKGLNILRKQEAGDHTSPVRPTSAGGRYLLSFPISSSLPFLLCCAICHMVCCYGKSVSLTASLVVPSLSSGGLWIYCPHVSGACTGIPQLGRMRSSV